MIELPAELLAAVVSHARRGAPNEVCGWLAGKDGRVERVYPVANVAEHPRRAFLMDPEAQLRAMREIRESGMDLAGTYHSHPTTPPHPSFKDQLLAYYPDAVHLIISLAEAEPAIACFRITDERIYPVEISIR